MKLYKASHSADTCPKMKTILRQPALGDVEVGHDLDARDHGGAKALGRGFDVVQNAVDAVAHRRRFSNGSTWMSDARMSSALVMRRLTRRMTGASDARSFSCWTSASNASSSTRVRRRRSPGSARTCRCRRAARARLRARWGSRPSAARRARSPFRTRRS